MSERPVQADIFIQRVGRFIDARRLLPPGSRVLVGVSGGADSVALLAALRRLAEDPARGYELSVAHLDHGLRTGSAEDAAFVADLAGRWRLPCTVERHDVAAARKGGVSIEEAGRLVRYRFLRDAAERAGATRVAVGHHADDNVETILYRIVRGTHLRGLAGIRPARSLGTAAVLVRPLLSCRRSQIEAFCKRAGVTWREDASNFDRRFRRNFIRHELLPLLRSRLNPRADDALLRLGAAAEQTESVVSALGVAAMGRAWREDAAGRAVLDAASLAAEPAGVRAMAIRLAMERLGLSLRQVGAERFAELGELPCLAPPSAVALPGGYVARREGGDVLIEAASRTAASEAAVVLSGDGVTRLPDGRCVVCRPAPLDRAAFETHCRTRPAGVEVLDADKVRGPLVCRGRHDGDAFVPLGSPGRQKVGVFLTNLGLPRRRRDAVRCICDEMGIVFLAPLRIDDRVKVTAETRRVLQIELRAD